MKSLAILLLTSTLLLPSLSTNINLQNAQTMRSSILSQTLDFEPNPPSESERLLDQQLNAKLGEVMGQIFFSPMALGKTFKESLVKLTGDVKASNFYSNFKSSMVPSMLVSSSMDSGWAIRDYINSPNEMNLGCAKHVFFLKLRRDLDVKVQTHFTSGNQNAEFSLDLSYVQTYLDKIEKEFAASSRKDADSLFENLVNHILEVTQKTITSRQPEYSSYVSLKQNVGMFIEAEILNIILLSESNSGKVSQIHALAFPTLVEVFLQKSSLEHVQYLVAYCLTLLEESSHESTKNLAMIFINNSIASFVAQNKGSMLLPHIRQHFSKKLTVVYNDQLSALFGSISKLSGNLYASKKSLHSEHSNAYRTLDFLIHTKKLSSVTISLTKAILEQFPKMKEIEQQYSKSYEPTMRLLSDFVIESNKNRQYFASLHDGLITVRILASRDEKQSWGERFDQALDQLKSIENSSFAKIYIIMKLHNFLVNLLPFGKSAQFKSITEEEAKEVMKHLNTVGLSAFKTVLKHLVIRKGQTLESFDTGSDDTAYVNQLSNLVLNADTLSAFIPKNSPLFITNGSYRFVNENWRAYFETVIENISERIQNPNKVDDFLNRLTDAELNVVTYAKKLKDIEQNKHVFVKSTRIETEIMLVEWVPAKSDCYKRLFGIAV